MSTKTNNLTTKRFVIRKSLIGKHTIITFVNKNKNKYHTIMMKYTILTKKDLKV